MEFNRSLFSAFWQTQVIMATAVAFPFAFLRLGYYLRRDL